MATSGDPPSSHSLTVQRANASLRRSEQRLAATRERRQRQRYSCLGCITLLLLLIAGIWGITSIRRNGPAAPQFIVVWPKYKFQQRMVSGATVLVRPSQPFTITVEDAEKWNLQWVTADVLASGSRMQWGPAQDNSTLLVRCRPAATGSQRFTARLWPERQIVLHGKTAPVVAGLRHRVTPPKDGLWIFPLILAKQPLTWDEHALALLMQATSLLPAKPPTGPAQPLWTLVPSFDLKTLPPASDIGTYAMLSAMHPENDLPWLARKMAQTAPKASIKFIVRLNQDEERPGQGILRIAFDGKGERGGWLKRFGVAAAEPVKWWEDAGRSSLAR
ncbi:MAG: hypothetical protein JO316_24345 [Abitibacteriaceae bacterium]|nr:hypothetical protein [Abditibacteriaceae bacterium]